MDKFKISEIKNKSTDELYKLLKDCYREIANLKLEISTNKQKNVHLVKRKRKEIAKIKTVLKEKDLEEKNG